MHNPSRLLTPSNRCWSCWARVTRRSSAHRSANTMKTTFAIFFVLVCASIAIAGDAAKVATIGLEGVGDVTSICQVRGKSYDLNLPPKRLASAPAWRMRPGEEPSVSSAKALSAAKEQLFKAFTDGAEWEVQRISIERVPEPAGVTFGLKERWFYEVSFAPPEALRVESFLPQEYRVYVLMDGSIIAPVERKAENAEPAAAPNAAAPHR